MKEKKTKSVKSVKKTISIREDQAKWLEEKCISLSKLVQRVLDDMMREEREKGKERKV